MTLTARPVIGLVVNPIAGVGGPFAAKGSDDPALVKQAHAAGIMSKAPDRAHRAMIACLRLIDAEVVTGPGFLGQSACGDATLVDMPALTGCAQDTRNLVSELQDRVDLILFCGGDGTARDVVAANTKGVPILGIPAGVKMHSGVFGRSPEWAGQAAAEFLSDPARRVDMVEVMDIDEAERRQGRLSARLYAVTRTPAQRGGRQGPKAAGGDLIADMDAAIADYVRRMDAETLYLLGPGTTMNALKDRIGSGSLLGVDAALTRAIMARDLSESAILDLLTRHTEARIVLTVVGGQGFVLGRGNQQLSARVIRAVGPGRIDVICASAKLAALDPQELTIDTGDITLDTQMAGYWQIMTGPGRRQVVRVAM